MINLEKILSSDSRGSPNQELIDFLIDKQIETAVFNLLQDSSSSFRFFNNPEEKTHIDIFLSLSHDINTYPILEKKINNSVSRYQPFLNVNENKPFTNMDRFNNRDLKKTKDIQPFSFRLDLEISQNMKLKNKLDSSLTNKETKTVKKLKI